MNRLLYGVPHPCELEWEDDDYYNEDEDMERYYIDKYGD
jgi:hypothetical protein